MAFANAPLVKVTLSKNLLNISQKAFINCNQLKSIEIPDSVIEIGEKAFARTNLTSIKLSKNIKAIGLCAFDNIECLQNVTIEAQIVINRFNDTFFNSQKNVMNLWLYDPINEIPKKAFIKLINLENIVLPNSLQKIGDESFYNLSKMSFEVFPQYVSI